MCIKKAKQCTHKIIINGDLKANRFKLTVGASSHQRDCCISSSSASL